MNSPPACAATATVFNPGPPSSKPPKAIAPGSRATAAATSAIEPSWSAGLHAPPFSTEICMDIELGAMR